MEIRTLRRMTTDFCCRTLDPQLESHLPQYAVELDAVLQAVRASAKKFPDELAPAAVFSLKQDGSVGPIRQK